LVLCGNRFGLRADSCWLAKVSQRANQNSGILRVCFRRMGACFRYCLDGVRLCTSCTYVHRLESSLQGRLSSLAPFYLGLKQYFSDVHGTHLGVCDDCEAKALSRPSIVCRLPIHFAIKPAKWMGGTVLLFEGWINSCSRVRQCGRHGSGRASAGPAKPRSPAG